MIFGKLDREKIEAIKRKQSEKTRSEVESHYLNVVKDMRFQHDKNINETVIQLKKEHKTELDSTIDYYNKESKAEKKRTDAIINELRSIIKHKQEIIEDSQKAWCAINAHLPRMQHLSIKARMFKEMKVSPYLDDFKEAQTIEDEWDAYIRSFEKHSPKINKLLRMEKIN